ncbi:MAG: hypothetical protein ABH829_04215 [archaeon]
MFETILQSIQSYGTLPIAVSAIVFSFVFYLTSLQDRCWYRRYMLPTMLLSMALFLPTLLEKALLVASGILAFIGYKGRGREAMGK